MSFRALVLDQSDDGVQARVTTLDDATLDDAALPDGDVTVAVEWSSLNYKDGMILGGIGRLVRTYPHVPGVDLAGTVVASSAPDFAPGDRVVCTGFFVGERSWGGYAALARVRSEWLVKVPDTLTTRRTMEIGTAGLTAMLCVDALERAGVTPDDGPVLCTGAAGGVGTYAVHLLARLGYQVTASTGRPETEAYLRDLGAHAVIGRDEIGDLAQALDRMRDELAATDAARRAFVANASHELRTPVFALSGFMELLEDEEDPARRDQYLATMADQVGRLTRLATDLLDLSRLDSGKVPLDIEPVELSAVAARVASDLAAVARARGAIVDVAADPAMALGDETRIGQIARALVDNALKHNPDGVHVRIATRTGGGIAALAVEDSGPRIPEDEARAVFGRFARGQGAGEGSGLGLAIASELAERMGGRLVLDQTGERKAFRLDLAEDAGNPPPPSD